MPANRDLLVLEPSDDDRVGLAETLRRKGIRVESSGDARALLRIRSQRYAMVVIDSATPGVDGVLLAEALHGLAQRPIVLVVVDRGEIPRGFGADAIQGFVRRGDGEQLAELVRDCVAALRGTASQPAQPADRSLRIPQ